MEIRDGHLTRKEAVALAQKYEENFQKKLPSVLEVFRHKRRPILGNC